jgi:ABC-type Fe3+-hydroxamate transport system substrate-binding protein
MPSIRSIASRSAEVLKVPQRVVSLVPSITETLFDLGAGESVVGVTDFCIFPPDLDRARVGGTKNPRVEAIRALAPDLVHMNLEENLERHADAIQRFTSVHVTEPKSVADVDALIEGLGEIYDRRERAALLTAELHEAVESLPKRRFTFACAIWKKPWMWCGGDTYVSSLISTAGGRNVLQESTRYPVRSIEDIAALHPEVIFLPDEPYLFTNDDAKQLAANTKAQVVGPFPGHLFTWHGTRTIHGLRFLRDVSFSSTR